MLNILHASEQPDDQKPHRPHESEQTQRRHGPQHHTHVYRAPLRIILLLLPTHTHPFQPPSRQNDGAQREIAKHPDQHDRGPEALVIILLLLRLRYVLHLLGRFLGEDTHFGVVLGVEVAVVLGDGDVDLASRFEVGGGEFGGFVVAFRAPGDVVGVAEGVDVEDVDVGGGEEEVLDEL